MSFLECTVYVTVIPDRHGHSRDIEKVLSSILSDFEIVATLYFTFDLICVSSDNLLCGNVTVKAHAVSSR